MRARLIKAERHGVMTVFDEVERRTVAKAMYKPSMRSWLLHLYEGCWLLPEALVPSKVTGKVLPEYVLIKGKPEARTRMLELVRQINCA